MQELLLLNHPVDCPICDQAGECKLQDYYETHLHQLKRKRTEPVHKPKGVRFGPAEEEAAVAAIRSQKLWMKQGGTRVPAGRYLVCVEARTEDGSVAKAITALQVGN